MKNLLKVLFALVSLGAMAYWNSVDINGKNLASQAANIYCTIMHLEQTPNLTKTLQEDLKDLKCEHSALMSRGYTLRGEERITFTSTYSSMVSYCN